ncbi:hypothetical protein GCM10020000_58580 [Streptomyces olivoverticillatus]
MRVGRPREESVAAVGRSGRASIRSMGSAARRASAAPSRAWSRPALREARAAAKARAVVKARLAPRSSPVRWLRPSAWTSTPGVNGRSRSSSRPGVRSSSGKEVLSSWPVRSSRKPSITSVVIRPPGLGAVSRTVTVSPALVR